MFSSIMADTATLPDLSLQISPPSDSGSSGSDLSHEKSFQNARHRFNNYQITQIYGYGHHFKRGPKIGFGIKRSIRAPRMRWTTTLHAHFVHAVQLLGGHESTHLFTFIFIRFSMFYVSSTMLITLTKHD